jgi:hypothetical protein
VGVLTTRKRSLAFYGLLHEVEWQIGSRCYNADVRNQDGSRGGDYRYPVTFEKDDKAMSYREERPFTEASDGSQAKCVLGEDRYESAHYAFGANNLHILKGIRTALEEIERRFGLDFDRLLEDERIKNEMVRLLAKESVQNEIKEAG